MKISFSTLGCPRWSWREILATACDLGYGGVEVRGVGNDISVPSIPAFSDENLDKTKAELARLNLAIPCLDSDCCIHLRETEQTTNEEIRAYIHLAQKLGVPYVRVMATAPVPQPAGTVDEGYVQHRAVEMGHYALEHGVKMLIETNGVWSDSEKLARADEHHQLQRVWVSCGMSIIPTASCMKSRKPPIRICAPGCAIPISRTAPPRRTATAMPCPALATCRWKKSWARSRMAATTGSIAGMGQALGYDAGGTGHRLCALCQLFAHALTAPLPGAC